MTDSIADKPFEWPPTTWEDSGGMGFSGETHDYSASEYKRLIEPKVAALVSEIERLRVEIADLLEENRLMTNANAACGRVLVDQRAQLAERDALLHSLDCAWNSHDGKERFGKLMRKVETLSASAGPSSPTWSCQACQAEQPTDRACDACGGQTAFIAAES